MTSKSPRKKKSSINHKIASEICHKIVTTKPPNNNVKKICASNKAYPCFKTFYKWLSIAASPDATPEEADLLAEYNNAMSLRESIYHDEQLNIAYDASDDLIESAGGGMKPNSVAVSRAKLKIDTITYLLKVSNPKKYGDRTTQDHTGSVTVTHQPYFLQIQEDG